MDSYLARGARTAFKPDRTLIRFGSAIRRALVLALAFGVVSYLFDFNVGYLAALGALFAGVLDRGDDSTRVAALAMAQLAGYAFVVVSIVGSLAAWPALAILGVAASAATAGVASAVSMSAARVCAFGTVVSVAGIFSPVAAGTAVQHGAAIAAGALLQALAAAISIPISGDINERRRVYWALTTVADSVTQAARPDAIELSNRAQIGQLLARSEALIVGSDLQIDRRETYLRMLEATQLIRDEAVLSVVRHRDRLAEPASPGQLLAAAQLLRTVAEGLINSRFHQSLAQAKVASAASAVQQPNQAEPRSADWVLASACRELTRAAHDLVSQPYARRTRLDRHQTRLQAIRDGLAPGQLPRRHAIRLAIAAFVACTIALWLDIDQAAWIAMTAITVLRPDIPSTSKRTMMRAGGTIVGVLLVLALIVITRDDELILLIISIVLAAVAYSLMMVNYSYFVGAIVGVLVILRATISPDPVAIAVARVDDVLIGCVIAVGVSHLVPIWTRSRIRGVLAEFTEATAVWFNALASAALRSQLSQRQLTGQNRTMRSHYANTLTAFGVAHAEPQIDGIDVNHARDVFDGVVATMRSAQAGYALLLEDIGPDPLAAQYAGAAATKLAAVATRLRATEQLLPPRDVAAAPLRALAPEAPTPTGNWQVDHHHELQYLMERAMISAESVDQMVR